MKQNIFKQICGKALIGMFVVSLLFGIQGVVFAAEPNVTTSILPAVEYKVEDQAIDCEENALYNPDLAGRAAIETILKGADQTGINNVLGCGIKTGNIKLYMVPYYIRSVLEFVIGISGLACVGAIVFGGYWYLFAGVSEDKEKGKKAIMYGLVGMVLTLVAWALVNIIIGLLTM